ncbi:hypothetical protein T4E_4309 [Trichinella pseudospiralis]|uniref:Uncharacterized protein n=1 Tax=Trichinella pseudospiralis TaxID=6337 RepID=A0A0V0XWF3_TRIPS|nr:hypothetical protein T4E_4309 [Trichinella pseudospiralis]
MNTKKSVAKPMDNIQNSILGQHSRTSDPRACQTAQTDQDDIRRQILRKICDKYSNHQQRNIC